MRLTNDLVQKHVTCKCVLCVIRISCCCQASFELLPWRTSSHVRFMLSVRYFLFCLSTGGPNSLRPPCEGCAWTPGGLGRPRPFCMCALQVSFPRLTAPFASAHLSGLCASRWSGERILMTLTISTTNSPHRLCSYFLPLNSNMYLKARKTMSGTTRVLWATLSLCLHLWVGRACHHVPFKSNACLFNFKLTAWSWECERTTRSSWSVT